jgi:hypothetical protein
MSLTKVSYSMIAGAAINIVDFGASVSASASANTTAIQAAIDACPQGGTVLIPNGVFQIDDELIIDKAMTICGLGTGKWISSLGGSIVKQTNTAKNAFTLRASQAQYAFGAYGLNNVFFRDFVIEGNSGFPSADDYSLAGIGCDTTVNAGDYHIRECEFTNMIFRFFQTGVKFVGICYLNDFYGGDFAFCGKGFELLKGAATDRGGQTRFFGTTFGLLATAPSTCIEWNLDTNSGDLALFGCTLADASYGIKTNEESTITISGCSFENLKYSGNGVGIYIEIKEANPSSQGNKTIIGNKFLLNDVSIWIEKTTTALSGNSFSFPMLIDSNVMIDAEALRITLPSGEPPMSGENFVLGAANAGANGTLASSQISDNYAGRDMRKQNVARRVTFGPTGTGKLQLPIGMVVTSARVYFTANSSGFTALFGGDAENNNRYYSGINGQTTPLNTWTDWVAPVPQFIVNTESRQQIVLSGTGGLLGAVGVFEIQGYIP